MHKPKIYFDFSIINSLQQKSHNCVDTQRLFREIEQGLYRVCISDFTLNDIMNSEEPARSVMIDYLEVLDYDIIESDEKTRKYAKQLLDDAIVPEETACLNIGCAVVSGCDMILSWDFKYIANIRTISGVRFVNLLLGYKEIGIYPPSMVVQL